MSQWFPGSTALVFATRGPQRVGRREVIVEEFDLDGSLRTSDGFRFDADGCRHVHDGWIERLEPATRENREIWTTTRLAEVNAGAGQSSADRLADARLREPSKTWATPQRREATPAERRELAGMDCLDRRTYALQHGLK